ncbi:uncharacterized protein LOC143656870 [Tamandua tetradactyla]|uniref:uncharacterized protein LOC143656870 n=1 Tax=Tamandua tetradactyla TaxID=48850 RepID=UPI00405392F5
MGAGRRERRCQSRSVQPAVGGAGEEGGRGGALFAGRKDAAAVGPPAPRSQSRPAATAGTGLPGVQEQSVAAAYLLSSLGKAPHQLGGKNALPSGRLRKVARVTGWGLPDAGNQTGALPAPRHCRRRAHPHGSLKPHPSMGNHRCCLPGIHKQISVDFLEALLPELST